ncbi:MAG TPA: ribbon-helix-helix protein, CopG family [Thermoanaerobaculia bacterium]|nr:ribbon-helix-helix protein, CopG family [Thermoanaerobaculia bacterium]
MRTTLTLDDDVVKELRAAARRSGRTFKASSPVSISGS